VLVKAYNLELSLLEKPESDLIGQKYIKQKIQSRVHKIKYRAKEKHFPFNVSFEYLLDIFPINFKCPALNTFLNFEIYKDQPTIDRVIPEIGYVEGNIIWVSFYANLIMSNAHPKEVIQVGKFAEKIFKQFYPQLYTNVLNNKKENHMKKRTLLIDGDIVLYQVASQCEIATDWGEGMWTLHSDLNHGIPLFEKQIEAYKNNLQADDVIICLTGHDNFRKKLFDQYKLNRADRRKPLILNPLREYVETNYNCLCENILEADDVMGIHAQQSTSKHEYVIVSIDKDMKSVPCLLSSDGYEIIKITQDQADYNFAMQTLVGDSTDNFGGCPSVGPKKAALILSAAEKGYWDSIVKAFEKVQLTEQYAIQQAQMAYILRNKNDYNFKTKEVQAWLPK
jgi:DNA polymerase-1